MSLSPNIIVVEYIAEYVADFVVTGLVAILEAENTIKAATMTIASLIVVPMIIMPVMVEYGGDDWREGVVRFRHSLFDDTSRFGDALDHRKMHDCNATPCGPITGQLGNWASHFNFQSAGFGATVFKETGESQTLQWNTIAASVPGRTNKDCRKRYYYKVSATVNKGTWTVFEDEKLRTAFQKCGPKWTKVAAEVGTRSADQCSKRWNNTLDPGIDQSPWNPQDVSPSSISPLTMIGRAFNGLGLRSAESIGQTKTLLRCVEQQGHNWKSIVATHFPTRTALSARNQYNYMCRRSGVNNQPSTPSSNQSNASSRPQTRSNMQPVGVGVSYPTQPPGQMTMESDGELSDSDDDDFSSDAEGNDELMPNHTALHGDYVNHVSHVASAESQIASLMEMDSLYTVSTSNELPQFPSVDRLPSANSAFAVEEPSTYLQLPSAEGFAAQIHSGLSPLQDAFSDLVSTENNELRQVTKDATSSYTSRKTVTIRSTCSGAEVRRLMHTTANELQYIDFCVTSRESNSPPGSRSTSHGGTREVVITTSCPVNDLGRLMGMASAVLGSVTFSIGPSNDDAY
ncbi:MAG: hypothetical protein Q9209_006735 [Squamulea sp. 1 TL-2023]